jgi:hypothetical protein
MNFIIESMYWRGTGKFSNSLKKLLLEVLGCAPAKILWVFFCKVKIFPLLAGLPPKSIPYFIIE